MAALIGMATSDHQSNQHSKPSTLVSFSRYNLVAVLATGIDFAVLILLTEVAGLWYLLSTVFGALAGAITAFLLGRNWVFKATDGHYLSQAARYIIVASGSLLLNAFGVYAFTEWGGIQYVISKAITAILVGVFYNYLLSKHWIFK